MATLQHASNPPSTNGEIDHMCYLSDCIGGLYLNDEYSDVKFCIDNEVIPAHKVILAARSEYFR